MKKLIYLLIAIAFLFNACGKKKYHTIVKGKVINYGSKAPIEGVAVILQHGVAASGPFHVDGQTSSDKKNIAYTDANGTFKVELKGEHLAYLGLKKEGYSYEHSIGGAVVGIKAFADGLHEDEVLEMKAEAVPKSQQKKKDYTF